MTEALTLRECPNCGNPSPFLFRKNKFVGCDQCGLTGPDPDPTGECWNRMPRRSDSFKLVQTIASWTDGARLMAFLFLLASSWEEIDFPLNISIAQQHVECHPYPHAFISALAGASSDPETYPVLFRTVRLQLMADLLSASNSHVTLNERGLK